MYEYIYMAFNDLDGAKRAIGALLDHGAVKEDISLVYKGPDTSNHALVDSGPDVRQEVEVAAKEGISTTTPDDAAAGAAKGAVLGFGIGALAAISAIAVPGFGLVAGGGALALAVAGTAGTTAAGAIAGGVVGWLVDQGVPEPIAVRYNELYRSGNAILGVSVPTGPLDELAVRGILDKYRQETIEVWPDLSATSATRTEDSVGRA
ncbi:MAG TPA: hypothetical protein VKT78_09740 [Fimbriimonadaceae bacterium]|nr:hypothetical protein [Fimbriimonadaceae bacterium]